MSLGRLATWCHHHRWRVLGAWVLAVVAVTALGRAVGGTYVDSFSLPNVESKQAFQILQARFPARAGDSAQIVFRAPVGVTESEVRVRMERLFAEVGRLPHVVEVSNPYAASGRATSRDGTIGLATVQFDERSRALPQAAAERFVAAVVAAGGGGLQVEAGGSVAEAARGRALPASEAIGLVAAIVILLVAFGSVIAMGLPVLTAVLGLGVGLGALTLVAAVFDVPKFGPQMAAMIGLGVGVDYALFIVTRYRQELRAGRDPKSATRVALSTSGRAVVFAGSVVIVSLLGMFLMGLSFVRGLALGAVIAVLTVMLASITLLPAMLGFAGRAIDTWHLPGLRGDESEHRASVWFRWSRQVQRHPWPYALVGLVVLVALALPALSIRLGNSDAGNDSTQQTTRRAYDLLSRGFGPGFNGPLVLAARAAPRHDERRRHAGARDARCRVYAGRGVDPDATGQPGRRCRGDHRVPHDRAAGRAHRRIGAPTARRGAPRRDARHGDDRARRRQHRHRSRSEPLSRVEAARCSSVPCCSSRSCCS